MAAITGKAARAANRRNKQKPLRPVAAGCVRSSMVSRASAVGRHPLREVPSGRRRSLQTCEQGDCDTDQRDLVGARARVNI